MTVCEDVVGRDRFRLKGRVEMRGLDITTVRWLVRRVNTKRIADHVLRLRRHHRTCRPRRGKFLLRLALALPFLRLAAVLEPDLNAPGAHADLFADFLARLGGRESRLCSPEGQCVKRSSSKRVAHLGQ